MPQINITDKELKQLQKIRNFNEKTEQAVTTVKTASRKTKKFASKHAPLLGAAAAGLVAGFGAGLTDGNPNTYFDFGIGTSTAAAEL